MGITRVIIKQIKFLRHIFKTFFYSLNPSSTLRATTISLLKAVHRISFTYTVQVALVDLLVHRSSVEY